jgi:cholesterol transport system auxiliary component
MKKILYVSLCLLTGCLARPHLDKQSFIFGPPPAAASQFEPSNRVLGIRSLRVAEPFDGRSFVYRTGEFSYDRDPYAEFMARPAEELILPIGAWFRLSGGFSAVVEPGSGLKPDTLLEIEVVRMYGDFRPGKPPAAVLAMRFMFFDAPDGVPGKVILDREYSRNIPLQSRTAADLMQGWTKALGEILGLAMADFDHYAVEIR